MRKIPLLMVLLPTALLPTVLRADEVFLKGAGTISGRIVEQTNTMVMVDLGSGVMGVPSTHVERIVRARGPFDEYAERAGRLASVDLEGWQELGRWAVQQGLSMQARRACERVLAIAPNDFEAREAMGFVLLDGRWVTEVEGYRARGFVKYAGEWMMPAEAQRLLSRPRHQGHHESLEVTKGMALATPFVHAPRYARPHGQGCVRGRSVPALSVPSVPSTPLRIPVTW